MTISRRARWALIATAAVCTFVLANPFPGLWGNGSGPAVHFDPVAWPSEPVNPLACGATCGDWKPYTRFRNPIGDPRTQDPSNGGTAPQNYVNVASSCTDKTAPSVYYYLHRGATPADDVIMFRWRVEQPAHNYATGPSPGTYGSSSPWSSAQWTVLFDVDGSGYRSLAAHLNGSSGSPAEPVDMLVGVWSSTPNQSIDYSTPGVYVLGHNPTAFVGPSNRLMNFHGSMSPDETWPNGAAETQWDYGTTRAKLVSASPCGEYFIDYQIPVAMLDASAFGGPSITRDTPISMLFCTANSLSNPFQKDCAINRTWTADATRPAPFGDYLSFNRTEPYQQPIVSAVTATPPASCPGSYSLSAKVQDALAVQSGVVVPTVQAVSFYYWQDRNADGEATAADTGSEWVRISGTGTLKAGTLNTWQHTWNAGSLPKGKYLIGVQALDDDTLLDDGMTPSGIDNRTFSYLPGDAANEIYIGNLWRSGQQAAFPAHSPVQTPGATENWYGNPSVTGLQVALVGTAINACGVAPTISLGATPASVAAGATVSYTVTLANPGANSGSETFTSVSTTLPNGFTYVNASSSGTNGLPSTNPSVAGQVLTWTLSPSVVLAPGQSATLSFDATATSTPGVYNATASAASTFGALASAPATTTVDSARLSLTLTPNAYSIAADGSTSLTYTLRYANDSGVGVTGATATVVLPANVNYVGCTGGSLCANAAGTVTWTLGSIAANSSGTTTLTVNVANTYTTNSLAMSATLAATPPGGGSVNANASATVAVTGIVTAGSPAFTLVKTASATTVAPGGALTYTLSWNNYGSGSASSVVLTDTLPAGMTYVSCSNSCNYSSGTVTWNIGSAAAGASGAYTINVTAATPFTAANPATNSASISWSGGGPVTSSVATGVTGQSCSTYYYRNTTANVGSAGTQRIANSSPAVTSGNTGTGVTITAPVSGSSFLEAVRFYQDPATTNDVPFDGNITSNIYIDRANGQSLDVRATVYDYNSTNGATSQLGTLTTNFGGNVKGLLSMTVTPTGTLANGHRLLWVYEARSGHNSQTVQVQFQFAGTVTNGISGGTTAAISYASYCVTPPANLTVSNLVSAASIVENTTPVLTYTIRYANAGSANATNTSVVGTLPTGLTGCQYSTNGSSWSACSNVGSAPQYHSFSLGTLAGGASGTVYVRGTVPSGTTAGSTLTGTATVDSDQTVAAPANALTAVAAAGSITAPALTMNLTADRSTAAPGAGVVYTATVINTGTAAATNVVVSNTVPATAYYTYGGCTGTCGVVGNVLTWPNIASLAAGASQSYTYTMNVGTTGLPAGVTLINDSAGAAGDSSLTATSNTVGVTLNGNPQLGLLNNVAPTVNVRPDTLLTYTLTLTNGGASDASTVMVTNPLPANTDYAGTVSASQGTGSFDAVNNRLRFDVGTLASGTSATLSFTARVRTPLPSGNTLISSTATASSGNAAEQVATANVTAAAAAVLEIAKTAPATVAYPSATLSAAAGGTVLLVDRTDRLQLNQLVKVGSQVARVVALTARSITVDSAITAGSGTPVHGAIAINVSYWNSGDADATGLQLRESLQAGFGYYSSTPAATAAPIAGSSGDVDFSLGTLAAGASGTVEILSFPIATGSFTNPTLLTSSNTASANTSSITAIGGLSFAKATTTATVSAGGVANYTITASNSLGGSVSPVSITDRLPAGFSYRPGTATVGGVAVEPTFDGADTASTRPIWSGLTIPGSGTLVIAFQADAAASAGAGAYQNELDVTAPGGAGVIAFDALLTTAEDVTVLAAASGVARGYVFQRASGNALSFDPLSDTPLAGVRVEIHKPGADCNNPVGNNCYVVSTDADGYFERIVAAEDWIVSVVPGTGALPGGWYQLAGTNDNTVSVPDQGAVTDYNGFTSSAPPNHLVSTSAGANGSISPTSRTIVDGNTTTFTVTPDSGYSISSASGCGGGLSGNTFTTGAITGACTVSASFVSNSVPTHNVTASAGSGGSISPSNATVADGSTTSFTVTPDVGQQIAGVTGCGGSLTGNTYTTGAITAACSVSATFTPVMITVSTSAGANGSIGPASASVAYGATTSFTVTPDSGYDIASTSGCGGSLSGNTFTTGAITSACTVNASFISQSVPSFLVTSSAGAGGSVSPGSVLVASGATTSFTVTPDPNYLVSGAAGCGGSLSGNTFTTAAISGACNVAVSFVLNQHTVSAIAGAGGSISPPSQSVIDGNTTSLSVTSDTGYAIGSVSGCNGSLSGTTYATGAITGACTVTASFNQLSYMVTVVAGTGGSVSPGSMTTPHGSTMVYTVTQSSGYSIAGVSGCGGSLSGNTYTTAAITGACTVTASFSANNHTVTATAGTGGSITPPSQSVAENATTSFTVTPNTGYSIAGVSGCGGSLSGNTFTTAAITGACSVTASFSANSYTVTASAGTGGSITPPSLSVAENATTSFTVTPNSGYSIASVSGCGGSLSGNTFTTAAITGACAVSATFSANTYTVTASAGNGGSISPPSQSVAENATTSFTVTPNSGYSIASVAGCGGSLSGNTFTTAAINGACSVTASFSANTYTVTASAGSGGSITPPSQSVAENATTNFTVTPSTGYSIASVSGCGGSLAGSTFTTAAITGACSVTASFSPLGAAFDPAPPARINARSLTAGIPMNIAPTARDAQGNTLAVTLVGGQRQLRPGRHTLTWRAVDSLGNEITTEQQFDVWPMVSAGNDIAVGFGSAGVFGVVLNGDAPQYPYTVAFTVAGPGLGTLHNLAPASATFTSGTEAWVTFNALPQGTSMPVQKLTVSLDPAENLGARGSLDVSLLSANEAPRAVIVATQALRTGNLVAQDGGTVTLRVDIEDANPLDTHTASWTVPAGLSVQTASGGRSISFDARAVAAGLAKFEVRVADSGTPQLATRATSTLAMRAASPVLGGGDANNNGITDVDEGWGDSGNGIPAYLSQGSPRNVLPEDAPVTDRYLVEGAADEVLRVGPYALLNGGGGARVDTVAAYAATATDVVPNVGGIFSVEAVDLAPRGDALMVIPQRAPIPADAVYRVWDPVAGRWMTFIENGANRLASAPGTPGYCPPPGDSAYLPGLTPGNLCVQVIVEDGGPNDADGLKNGTLAILGGVARKVESVVTGSSVGGKKGGGVMGLECLILAMLVLWRAWPRRFRCLAVVCLALPVMANAAEPRVDSSYWYGGLSLASVHNADGAREMDARLAAQGYDTETSLSGQHRMGGSLFVGYSWRWLAGELAYVSLGRMDTRIEGNTPVDKEYLTAISLAHPRSGEGPQLSAQASWPLSKRLDVIGRVGLFYWRNTLTAETASTGVSGNERQLDPVWSLGLRYQASERIAVRARADLYRLDGERLTVIELAATWRFGQGQR
jgi:uncharacterized repeat protein (TIGR01451 family)/fimbrial isopeptide formation D2 family protein